MSAPRDNLPRPPMPLEPWRVAQIECARCGTVDMPDWLAALPEWIAARDAEREGRLRAEARVRALEEALGEALEAAREPAAERALVDIRETARRWRDECVDNAMVPESEALDEVLALFEDHGFGGGS